MPKDSNKRNIFRKGQDEDMIRRKKEKAAEQIKNRVSKKLSKLQDNDDDILFNMNQLIELDQDADQYNIEYGNNDVLVQNNERMTRAENPEYSKLIRQTNEENKPQERMSLQIIDK